MPKLYKKLLGGVAATLTLTGLANAAPVSGSVNVDNDFIVVLSVTDANGATSNTKVYSGTHGNRWNRREDFRFEVPSKASNRQCSVNVIAWGDRAVSQGFAGIFRGPNGIVYTGGPGITAQATSITSSGWANSGGGPTSAQIDTIISGTFSPNPYEVPGTVTGGTNPWGSLNYTGQMNGVPASDFQWIWPTANQRTGRYSAFRMSCSDMVKPVPEKMGMTWGIRNPQPEAVNGVAHVGCNDKNGGQCEPYNGDTLCSTKLPILCINLMRLQKPQNLTESKWDKWSGGIIGTTAPMAAPNKLSVANSACVKEFGRSWRVAQFHDAHPGRSGWAFSAYGNVGTMGKRFWTDIDDQPNGVCWNRQQ